MALDAEQLHWLLDGIDLDAMASYRCGNTNLSGEVAC